MLDSWSDLASQVGTLVGAATVIGGLVIAWVRYRLSGDFASKADIGALAARMDEIESGLRKVPTHDDVRRLGDRISAVEQRIGGVERGVDVVTAEVRGIREGTGRIEHAVLMLTQHELAKQRERVT